MTGRRKGGTGLGKVTGKFREITSSDQRSENKVMHFALRRVDSAGPREDLGKKSA
jgi:hypothetical protein